MPNLVSLSTLRTRARRRANREKDDPTNGFVTDSEANDLVNQSWRKLYNLICDRYQEQYCSTVQFNITGATDTYSFATIGADNFYKALGVDMLVSAGGQYWQPLKRFNLAERGFGNPLAPLVVGVPGMYPLRYQIRGDSVVFMQPVPSATVRLLYIPVAPVMTLDTDTIDDVNGFSEYITVDAAIQMMIKEDSDTMNLERQLQRELERIITSASNRDAGSPSTIADTSEYGWWP